MKEQHRQEDVSTTEARRTRLTVDVPPELAEWLKSQALEHGGSVNSRIVSAIKLMREADELIKKDPKHQPPLSIIRLKNMNDESKTFIL